MMFRIPSFALVCLMLLVGPVAAGPSDAPPARTGVLPRTQWDHHHKGPVWTRTAMVALKNHGAGLERTVPVDIAEWCPAYPEATMDQRRAFWVGFLSALSKHESRWKPKAVGGGLWYGLLQIQPSTARGYGCRAETGEALKNGAANLSCAVRIMAVTVARDKAISVHNGRWRGVAADWGPLQSEAKRAEMSAWTRKQSYCRPLHTVRPKPRSGASG